MSVSTVVVAINAQLLNRVNSTGNICDDFLWFGLLARALLNQLNVFSFLTPVFGLMIGYFSSKSSCS